MRSLLVTLALLLAFALQPAIARATRTSTICTINTGLDPACPLTAAGISASTIVLNGSATRHENNVFGSFTWHGNQQLTLSLPIHDHLGIAGVGNAYGLGDAVIQYTKAFGKAGRLTKVAGASVSFATGAAAFSAGRTQLAPMYALSYALGDRIVLLAIAEYRFDVGGTKLQFAPRTQALTVTPRAIVDLSKSGLYFAADISGASVTGDERYQAYQSDGTIGLARRHYGIALTYSVPIAYFTRQNLFYHTLILQATWRP